MTTPRDPLAAYRPGPPEPLDLAAYRRVRDDTEAELRAKYPDAPDDYYRREASRWARDFVPFLLPSHPLRRPPEAR